MIFSYRYLLKRDKLISFLLILAALVLCFSGVWVFIIRDIGKEINEWKIIGAMVFLFIITGPFFSLNNKLIARKCVWDKVSIDNGKLLSIRYNEILLKDIKEIKINDLSKVYSFYIKTEKRKFKFSCLSFLGSEGGAEYEPDKNDLKSIANEITRLANAPEYNITSGKESTSDALFVVICLAMVMLIPGLIFAPQRMIFVIPFVVPLFFFALKKRKDSKKK
ncbi:hypothetical protein [Yersinia pseudotuberculosis]|uniref:PH domain-containing protein n=1 Tax=Yersinia pseudotuberculosis TaxID=633 RepID=A0ABN5R4W4_YERPU|nr:hypothetical protein [Yersinia pseudotuberculosis]AXY34732.1 hypothetical protein CEQ20_15960 [Yersinia pseudotuberculosis]AYW92040.1 hypothetical protein EGX47_12525 [Yersinia pseudotuberculosis]AYX10335.1 hypothetical protein EGX52_05650 [Yersinia pseudotuberculosis]MBO1568024.1 hypothetical protein [Yersinia pseudotuberculosis]MBO1604853.1 hypothetical protein [Yersinia pseudotuberculosis]